MSDEPQVKRLKRHHNNYKKNFQWNTKKKFLEAGQWGFLATCNFKEKACIRECYNILNHYADELYGPLIVETQPNNVDDDNKTGDNDGEAEEPNDIADDLDKEIENCSNIKKSLKNQKDKINYRFNVVDTGTTNCLFIKCINTINPIELGIKIIEDIYNTKKQRSRYLLRLIPISIVTHANLKDIIENASKLFDKYFLNNPKTFSVIFNKRYNNNIKKDDCIKELAELVKKKNIKNSVDLKNAQLSVIVEIIKGMCLLSVVPNYIQYKKYNLIELAIATTTVINNEESKNENELKKDKEKDLTEESCEGSISKTTKNESTEEQKNCE